MVAPALAVSWGYLLCSLEFEVDGGKIPGCGVESCKRLASLYTASNMQDQRLLSRHPSFLDYQTAQPPHRLRQHRGDMLIRQNRRDSTHLETTPAVPQNGGRVATTTLFQSQIPQHQIAIERSRFTAVEHDDGDPFILGADAFQGSICLEAKFKTQICEDGLVSSLSNDLMLKTKLRPSACAVNKRHVDFENTEHAVCHVLHPRSGPFSNPAQLLCGALVRDMYLTNQYVEGGPSDARNLLRDLTCSLEVVAFD
ncbi:hypothetical protein DOTSEDRAFT_39030 [Dothistroma septosporum NZE10]|uniref:Uncharacterized protein n=1 Tax=Dothistroma septosporum (strain NZE10 / CBS 128990) TaxID=675120 RepID=M2YIR1_DOTSN|nr:hypothetical protein DOTSEDRAFT_39030 [Dothistroma septosporum NZE10]